jgi:eukaryotic-like serine/threonine-protein kinase
MPLQLHPVDAALLDELLSTWESSGAQGRDLTPEDLCGDRLDLVDELRRRIEVLRASAFDLSPSGDPDSWDDAGSGERDRGPSPVSATCISRFLDLKFHARGGLGVVYKARDEELAREVALKFILAPNRADPDNLRRFRTEAEITGRLEHPGVVPIYGVGRDENAQPCYAMRYIEGQRFDKAIDKFHKTAWAQAMPQHREKAFRDLLGHFKAVCATVAYAHSRGIVHRDLKPANVMLGRFNETLVVDWGLAKSFAGGESELLPAEGPPRGDATGFDSDELRTRWMMGTLGYMSPEQAAGPGVSVGPASDVYGLGATLYKLLTNRPPIEAKGRVSEVVEKIQRGEFPGPSAIHSGTPRGLEAICLKALALRPEDRYKTATELADDVDNWLADAPVSARRDPFTDRARRWMWRHRTAVTATAAAALVALVGMTAVLAVQARANQRQRSFNRDLRRHLYDSQMNLANQSWDSSLIEQVERLLRENLPEGSGGDDLRGWEWYCLERLAHSSRLDLRGHRGRVNAVVYDGTGDRLATGGEDRTARVWSARDGRALATLTGHTGAVTSVAFSPDGRRLATASDDTTVKVWEGGRPVLTLEGHILGVAWVAFSPDGKTLATAGADTTVKLWDANTGRECATLLGHTDAVRRVAFRQDGQRLATGGKDGSVRVWDVATGEERACFADNTFPVLGLAYSPDGTRLVSTKEDWTLSVRNAETGRILRSLKSPTKTFADVAFRPPDGSTLATAGLDRTARLWDAADLSAIGPIKGHFDEVHAVAFSPDGSHLASTGSDGTVRVWDAAPTAEARVFLGHDLTVSGVAFSPDGHRLASSSFDHSVRVWDAETGRLLRTLGEHEVTRAPSVDGRPGVPLMITTRSGHTGLVMGVSFSPDGTRVASAGLDNSVRVWDIATGEVLHNLRHGGAVSSVAYSRDGRWIASGGWDDRVYLWDAVTGKRRYMLEGHTENVQHVAFRPDSRVLASAGMDATVRLWDVATGALKATLIGHEGEVRCVAFSADGRWLASGGADRIVRVWDADTFRLLMTLHGHTEPVDSVAFNREGTRIASGSHQESDRSVKLWDTSTGMETVALKLPTGGAHAVAFSADGHRLAAGSGSAILLWDGTPRAAQFPPAPAKALPASPAPPGQASLGPMKVLGSFRAKTLPDGKRQGETLRPDREDDEYLVVVVSVPKGKLMLSKDAYRAMEREAMADPERGLIPPRQCLYVINRRQFRFRSGGGADQTALGYGVWPMDAQRGGFDTREVTKSSSDALDPTRRVMLAVAFIVKARDSDGSPRVLFNTEGPVPVPGLHIKIPWKVQDQ